MSKSTVKSIAQMIEERPQVDNLETFEALWGLTTELKEKVAAKFELTRDPSTEKFKSYAAPNHAAKGTLTAFTGPEIDWMVYSWTGTPNTSFTNMHLTVNLGPHIRIPHFGFALGTAPDIFVYMDYIPRTDLMVDLEYLDEYYEPVNESYMNLRKDARFSPFVSQNLYMRQAQTHVSHCYMVPPSDETLDIVSNLGHEMMDRWLGYVENAELVPEAEQAALAARDLHYRRSVCERDPANAIAVRLFGQDMTDELVRALWGGDRILPRPGLNT